MSAASATGRRRGHARRSGRPLARRIRLPSVGRLLAILTLAAVVALAILGLNGPWLRVTRLAYAGNVFTSGAELETVLSSVRGTPLLSLDTASLAARLEELPAVASAQVDPMLPDGLSVRLTEKRPALVWQAGMRRLLLASDGRVVAEVMGELPASAAGLPLVEDERPSSQSLSQGASLRVEELELARRLLDLDPKLLGSRARQLSVRVDPLYGLVLESDVGWEAAMGFPTPEPGGVAASVPAQLDEQVAAMRTLFAQRRESGVSWVDVRNPGKVYWTP